MKTEIGDYDEETRSVSVVFTTGDIVHKRDVNACLTADGHYDADATEARVAQVARGVEAKIAVGVIVARSEPEPESASEPAEDGAGPSAVA